MGYELMGRAHAAVLRAATGQRGQGTVEYVGLMLLVAGILTAVVAAASKDMGIADSVAKEIKEAVQTVGEGKK